MKLFNKVIKKDMIENAELKITNAVYVPFQSMLIPNYAMGEIRNTMKPSVFEMTIEYNGEKYIVNDIKNLDFYLNFLKDIDFPDEQFEIKQDIMILHYKNGKKELKLITKEN